MSLSNFNPITAQQLPRSVMTAIGDHFKLPEIQRAERVSAGEANATFLLKTAASDYFVRFLLNQTRDQIVNDVAIQTQLQGSGLQAPAYRRGKDQSVLYELNQNAALVSERAEGIMPTEVTPTLMRELGRALGTFHHTVKSLPYTHRGWLNPDLVSVQRHAADAMTQQALSLLTLRDQIRWHELPRGIIHGDLGATNVLCKSDKVITVLDFEESEANIFLCDLAATLLVCWRCRDQHGLDEKLVYTKLLSGYEEVRPLSTLEKQQFPLVIGYTAAATSLWFIPRGFTSSAQIALDHGTRSREYL